MTKQRGSDLQQNKSESDGFYRGNILHDCINVCAGVEEIFMEYQTDIIRLVDLPSLVPVMNKHKLLTPQENTVLTDQMTVLMAPQDRCRQLTLFMQKKGDEGYQLFLQSLLEETTHLGHGQLHKLLPPTSALQSKGHLRFRRKCH